ncbi:MAG: LPS-assembly protein LptD [Desulfamplus sp.]|nr:LPS-assembly protein LptD [Desulfamplus sp.]
MSFLYQIFITTAAIAILLFDGFITSDAISFSASKDSQNGSRVDRSWHISALKVSYDSENQIYVAEDKVIITGGDIHLEADYVEFSNITRDAVASGKVLLILGKDNIMCDILKLNLETEMGTIYNGTIFVEENHFYIKGDKIEKIGKDEYRANSASVTSCDGETPDWRLSGKDVKVTIDGYGTVKGATLWAGKIPALYSPFLAFPAKTTRQTGLLTPRITSSDKKGFEFEQPLFLAISKNSDATFYSNYMSKRGTKIGLEYRYVFKKNGSFEQSGKEEDWQNSNYGVLFYDYLNDNSVENQADHNRYWFRMKNSHTFYDNWHSRVDIDYVSDANYLKDFKEGFTGFDSVNRYFSKTFGRSIDEYDDTTRENSLNINRTWSDRSLNIGAQWFDNVEARDKDIKDTTLQKLPSVDFDIVKKRLGSSLFYYSFDSEYRYFYRQNSFDISPFMKSATPFNGHRADISPTIYIPLRFGALYLEGAAGVRQSLWYLADYNSDYSYDEGGLGNFYDGTIVREGLLKSLHHREMFDLNLELSTKLARRFDNLKHEVVPKLEYSFIPKIDQNNLPYFDALDYIGEQNSFTWSIGNSFTSCNQKSGYGEFAWIEIAQSYRFDDSEPKELLNFDKLIDIDELFDLRDHKFKSGKSFSDISARVELFPSSFFSINSDIYWSLYDKELTSHEFSASIKNSRGDSIKAYYNYDNDNKNGEYESIFASLSTKINDNFSLFFMCEHSLSENRDIESHTGFYFNRPCWSMRLSYSDTIEDDSISFMLNLHGLGEFGKD